MSGEEASVDLGNLEIDQVVALIGSATDRQIAEGINGAQRAEILAEVFRRMEQEYRPGPSAQDAAIHWKITRAEADPDHWEVVIEDGICIVNAEPSRQPRLTMTIDGVDFLRLVTGNAAGPMLFMSGKLKIEGDIAFAAMMQSMFRIPSVPQPPRPGD